MTVSGLSEFSFDSVDSDGTEEEKIGNLGSHSVTKFKNDSEIAFLPFEKKYPLSSSRSDIPLAMTRCSRIDVDFYAQDQGGNTVGLKMTIYADERKEPSETDGEATSEINRDHAPDLRDRDFERDANGTW